MTTFRFTAVATCVAIIAGCAESKSPPAKVAGSTAQVSANGHDAAKSEQSSVSDVHPTEPISNDPHSTVAAGQQAVEVEIRNWDQTQELIASNKGKIVVVDLWSNSCLPCLREFPHLVAMQKKYPDTVACISVNLNYIGLPDEPPEASREEVLEFLQKEGATMRNIISSDADEVIYKKLMLSAIPAVYVYNQSGTLEKRFDNERLAETKAEFTYEKDVAPLVESLLAQPK